MTSAGVVLAETVCVKTPISAPWATPVTHATPVTSAQTRRSTPYPSTFPGPCGGGGLPRSRRLRSVDGDLAADVCRCATGGGLGVGGLHLFPGCGAGGAAADVDVGDGAGRVPSDGVGEGGGVDAAGRQCDVGASAELLPGGLVGVRVRAGGGRRGRSGGDVGQSGGAA